MPVTSAGKKVKFYFYSFILQDLRIAAKVRIIAHPLLPWLLRLYGLLILFRGLLRFKHIVVGGVVDRLDTVKMGDLPPDKLLVNWMGF